MKKMIALLASLAACGEEEPYAITFTELRLHQKGSHLVQGWHVDLLTNILLEEFRDGDEARESIKGTDVFFYDELPDANLDLKPGQIAGGFAESKKKKTHVLVNEREAECLAYSALQHELMHVIEYDLKGRTDSNHSDCTYWCAVDKAEARGRKELCRK